MFSNYIKLIVTEMQGRLNFPPRGCLFFPRHKGAVRVEITPRGRRDISRGPLYSVPWPLLLLCWAQASIESVCL